MAYGLYNINDAGTVLIDDAYSNLALSTSGTVSSITANTFYTAAGFEAPGDTNMIYWIVDYPAGTNPILAVKPPSNRNIGTCEFAQLNVSTHPLASGYKRAIFFSEGTTSGSLTYYVFDNLNPSGLLNTGYGMQILDSSGNLVFHSNAKYLRIIQDATLRGSTVGTNYTVSSSKTYAFLLSNATRRRYLPASGSLRRYKQACFKQTTTTNITIYGSNYWFLDQMAAGSLVDTEPDFGYIIDVTGY